MNNNLLKRKGNALLHKRYTRKATTLKVPKIYKVNKI